MYITFVIAVIYTPACTLEYYIPYTCYSKYVKAVNVYLLIWSVNSKYTYSLKISVNTRIYCFFKTLHGFVIYSEFDTCLQSSTRITILHHFIISKAVASDM